MIPIDQIIETINADQKNEYMNAVLQQLYSVKKLVDAYISEVIQKERTPEEELKLQEYMLRAIEINHDIENKKAFIQQFNFFCEMDKNVILEREKYYQENKFTAMAKIIELIENKNIDTGLKSHAQRIINQYRQDFTEAQKRDFCWVLKGEIEACENYLKNKKK